MKNNGTDLLYTVYACALEKVIIIISLLLTLHSVLGYIIIRE